MSNKFPQLEWITVDGRPTPVPKVQHYKKGSTTETELTGHDNPFPVANYTQNSNGIWMPVSTDNPVPTRLTGSSVEEGFSVTVENEQAIPVKQTNGIEIIEANPRLNAVIEPGETYVLSSKFNQKYSGVYVMVQSAGAGDKYELTFQPRQGSPVVGAQTTVEVVTGGLWFFAGVSSYNIILKNIHDRVQTIRRYEIGGRYFDAPNT